MRHKLKEAVALEYGTRQAPVVTAKGRGLAAEQILALARESGVYVAQDPQLLSLLSQLEPDQEIPADLYTAVAVILSWVYWMKGLRPGDEKRAQGPV
jgi:flagellar biosynthesis protein